MKKHFKVIPTSLLRGLSEVFVTSIIALSMFITTANAEKNFSAQNNRVELQDVDTDDNGIVSAVETNAYMQKLAIERAKELQRQKAEQEAANKPKEQVKLKSSINPADLNKDGIVSEQEKAAYLARLKSKTSTPKPATKVEEDKNLSDYKKKRYGWREGEMNALDKNQDGVLQESELKAGSATKFNSADKNRDGVLSPEETTATLKAFETQKIKSDDALTAKQQANRLRNRLKNADSDRDKKVSKAEYEAFMSKNQENFDQNGDGIISKDEYRSDGERIPSTYMNKKK